MANNLGVDMGMFYKRRDYSTIIDGRNPIVAHEFLGADVKEMCIRDSSTIAPPDGSVPSG